MAEDSSTGRSLFIVIAAFVLVSLAIGAYAYFNRTAPASSGEVLSLNLYPIHRDLSTPGSVNGLGGQADLYDEMLIFADVRIRNLAKTPLILDDMWATVDLGDSEQRSTAVSQSDFDKVFLAYPDAHAFHKDPMPRNLSLAPGEQHEGLMIFHYEIPKAQWDARKSMDLHISFKNQNDLVIPAPAPTAK
ncbi:hypothetical protein [Silvibacterium dinghuense]|uniref:DUF4352 domain-containing protein n=1 Tax=Silvibacterium dinghuense TaxID=1560006 RepID=A0A4Q1SBI9_9BACT|nr:hypothetical protein [Silvibacterium dinghuense]RXS94379.1 hypothetical protein ESZ00_14975 [Silvibacterium dinghuense]GGH16496.1 hypothetical protein GCM10011586_38360 [Silvibacterium dinghuense]